MTLRSAAKELCSCKLGLLSAAVERVLTVVKSAVEAAQKIFESRSALQLKWLQSGRLKRERTLITGHGAAVASEKKNANQYSWSVPGPGLWFVIYDLVESLLFRILFRHAVYTNRKNWFRRDSKGQYRIGKFLFFPVQLSVPCTLQNKARRRRLQRMIFWFWPTDCKTIIATTFLRRGFAMLVICWSEPKRLCLHGELKSREKPACLFGFSHLSTQRNRPKQKGCLFPQKSNCTV